MNLKLYEKASIKPVTDENFDENDGEETTKIYNHYLDECKDITKSTKLSYHELIGDFLGSFFQLNKTKLDNILARKV